MKSKITDPMEEYVEYTAPYAADLSDMTPIFVAVNGESIRIRRGQTVRIKRKFLEALRLASEQERAAMRYQRQAASAAGRALADM